MTEIEKIEISQKLLESLCWLKLNLMQGLDVSFKEA